MRAETTSKKMTARADNSAVADPHYDFCIRKTSEIVIAYVSQNIVMQKELPGLIAAVYDQMSKLVVPESHVEAETTPSRPVPAVPIRSSIRPDSIICLEDGKPFKSLRRHLKTRFNMTPEEYREKWGLPAHYPMVAPDYAMQRSQLAKKIGLGHKPKKGRKS